MSTSVATFTSRTGAPRVEASAQKRDRWVRRRVGITWGLLSLNVLTFFPRTWSGMPLVIPIPSSVGKMITQGALPLALLMALTVNRRIAIRPNVFLCLLSLLVIEALIVDLEAHHFGTVYRACRFAGFVATLWLLTPWWGRRDLLLVRCHLVVLSAVLGSVIVGALVAPTDAFGGHRLGGALWPFPPTDVAHFAAVTIGLFVVLWLSSLVSGRITLAVVAVAGTILLLTHTRTAIVAMIAGILVAGLSLFSAKAKVRKIVAAAPVLLSFATLALSGFLTSWLARGESTQQLVSLTGRTTVWAAVVSAPRTEFQVLFGSGLSNLSFNGLSIDSSWLGAYTDLGLCGVIICAAAVLFPLVSAYFQSGGAKRALGLFLVTYCLLSSFTETGLSDASFYMLELALGASLLVPSLSDRRLT
jgi:hypothetical protein